MLPHKHNYHSFFDVDQHLSEMGIAAYVDALINDVVAELPEPIIIHLQTCPSCKGNAIAIYLLEKKQKEINLKKIFPKNTPFSQK